MINEVIQNLLKYQAIDAELAKEQQKIMASDNGKKSIEAQKAYAVACDKINKLADELSEISSTINKVNETQDGLTKRAEKLDGNSEYSDDTNRNVNQMLQDIKAAESKLRRSIESLAKINADLAQAKNEGATAQRDGQAATKALEENEKKDYAVQNKDRINAQQELKKHIPEAVMARYEEVKQLIRARKVVCNNPVSKYKNGYCGGCGHDVKTQIDATITKTGYTACPNCRCILYIE